MAHGGIKGIIESGKAPGVCRTSRGPGSCSNELIFDRPNMKKDIPLTLKKMEESGGFVGKPDSVRAARIKLEEAKAMPDSTVDYQKVGHPLER